MSLPTYDKSKRRKSFEILPKGAYVVKILNAKELKNKKETGSYLEIAFDIAEGEYKGFYMSQYENDTNEDKKYPADAYFRLTVPNANSQPFIWSNWNSFFADLEDSNGGFVFSGDVSALKYKIIGGKFHNEQSEFNGKIYDHTRMRWTCVADDVRNGKPGRMPADKLIASPSATGSAPSETDFMTIPAGAESEIPF